ncbi:MAG: type II toxin-antitoxin system VapB family antitoxin [Cyanomargarita calcarea GSE-NOS-MK-12-04C]|uniref:Type II toxin-antitoxin system VapB family antitoxin n=1 Tax=Cyanomargarita calcarea GSE-NOS-MK-12-04C TaxID=2839659 RepID=A0A951QPG7_9CYAN|nr:type II toxin-antitoxin system VapB family antitoxin [Cyanomargarita calcarea GSE-NOS-MK-12-04C]
MRTNIQLDDALVEEAFRAKRRRNEVRNGHCATDSGRRRSSSSKATA